GARRRIGPARRGDAAHVHVRRRGARPRCAAPRARRRRDRDRRVHARALAHRDAAHEPRRGGPGMSAEVARRLVGHAALWRNPAFVRFARSRLRLRKSVFWLLLTIIVATFVVMTNYLFDVNAMRMPREAAARQLFLPLLIVQGLI